VELSRLRTVPGASGAALITVAYNGENAITVLPGANRQAPLPAPDDTLAGVGAVLMQLELPLATVLAWALHARRCDVPVLLNAAPAATLPDALWPALDTVLVNREELARLSGSGDLQVGLQALRSRGLRCVVVTLGAQGVIASIEGRRFEWPALQVPVVDTTGAGDTLAGVWAAWRLRGLPDDQALARANVAAALACTRAGARSGMPTARAAAAYARQAGVDWPQDQA
jgi:ribokinase